MKHKGYDYSRNEAVALSVREWRALARPFLVRGFARVDSGETFVHDERGVIALEIYKRVTFSDPRKGERHGNI